MIAYYNGEWMPSESLTIPVYDAGFMMGLTVAEQLRTFNGKLFRLDEHLNRMERSLEIVGVNAGLSRDDWKQVATELVERNRSSIDAADDLAVALWVTPGTHSKFSGGNPSAPTVCGHVRPIDFVRFQHLYANGQRLAIATIRQVSPQNWPVELKCRSRMHYHLADKEARERDPLARALLLDLDGFVCEATTANVLAHFEGEGLVAPKLEKTLPGISLGAVDDLARQLKIRLTYRDIKPEEIAKADEILLCSTSPCVWPVTHLDGNPVGNGKPGAVFQQLMTAWSKLVDVHIVEQSQRFADRD